MKLLLISVKSEISKGGIAVWTNMFLKQCSSCGIDCDLVNTEVVGKRLKKGVFMLNLKDEYVRTRRIFRDLKKALRNNKYDVVHMNTSCGTFGLFRDYIAAKRVHKRGIPLVLHFHCDVPFWITNRFSKACLKKLVKLSCENIVLCENSRKYLLEQMDVEAQIIPNFVEEDIIKAEAKEIKEKVEQIFFVGRIERKKGAAEMFELARRLPEITFKLAGNVSDEVGAWEIPSNLELMGSVPHAHVIQTLDESDLFLFPSHSEGFSLALAEAMARGVPSVATDVGANADMLSGGCGVITEVGDIDAMEKAIKSLRDTGARREASKNALEKVKREYRADKAIEKIKEAYINKEPHMRR